MQNYSNFLDVIELQIKYQEMWRDGIGIAICTVDLELESRCASLVRVWDIRCFISYLNPQSTLSENEVSSYPNQKVFIKWMNYNLFKTQMNELKQFKIKNNET